MIKQKDYKYYARVQLKQELGGYLGTLIGILPESSKDYAFFVMLLDQAVEGPDTKELVSGIIVNGDNLSFVDE